jgi:hypothetical protein
MQRFVAALLFRLLRYSRCPSCGSWGKFSRPIPAISGPVPAEVQGLVPLICRCPRGCTSSVRAITSLERRGIHVEA